MQPRVGGRRALCVLATAEHDPSPRLSRNVQLANGPRPRLPPRTTRCPTFHSSMHRMPPTGRDWRLRILTAAACSAQVSMDGTPTTVETPECGSNVKLEIGKSKANTGLTDESKLAHLLSLVVSGVIVVFLSAVLADGASVITLKSAEHLPRLTVTQTVYEGQLLNLTTLGLDYRADQLLGPGYAIGLLKDTSGYFWQYSRAGWGLQRYIDELGLLQVIAAVPSVIATDGAHPAASPPEYRRRAHSLPSLPQA